MNKILYLHIGPHKTGTTYIQSNLYRNKELLKYLNYFYPEPAKIIEAYNVYCHQELFQKPQEIVKLLEQSNSFSNYIVSFEGLSEYSKEQIIRLKQFIDEKIEKVWIIFVVRNPAERLYSLWQEKVKHGYTMSFSRFIVENVLKPFQSSQMSYSLCIDNWLNIFGESSLRLIDYHTQEDLFIKFLEAIDLDPLVIRDFQIKKNRLNVSLSIEKAEIIRTLNIFAKQDIELKDVNITLFYLTKRREDHEILECEKKIFKRFKKYFFNLEIGEYIVKNLWLSFIQKYNVYFIEKPQPWKSVNLQALDANWLLEKDIRDLIKIIYNKLKNLLRAK